MVFLGWLSFDPRQTEKSIYHQNQTGAIIHSSNQYPNKNKKNKTALLNKVNTQNGHLEH